MPPDSSYLLQNVVDTTALPDSIRVASHESIQSIAHDSTNAAIQAYTYPAHHQGSPLFPIFFFLFAVCIAILFHYLRNRFLLNRMLRVFEEKKLVYHAILDAYNPYYKSLDSQSQESFIRRTIYFMKAKEFKYIGLPEEEKIPLLISATAIQLTFGLRHYMLDYFKTIYVLKDNYRYGLFAVPFEGHVNNSGIYLSWNNFIREYADYTDGENVGLHEMAHALTYVNFSTYTGRDHWFRNKFYEFSPIARPIFSRMQQGETNLLNRYAASSYEEFWAVCIETFFERPFPFREQMPELYNALCQLLNQDPTTEEKVLTVVA